MSEESLVPQALEYLDPALLDYEEWLHVGMGLHAEGYEIRDWDEWSRRDPERYHPGECAVKWAGFGHGAGEVAGGTIVEMARRHGFVPEYPDDGTEDVALEWDAPIIDPAWVEPREVATPDAWDPVQEAIDYLSALFDSEDIVGYNIAAFERDGRWIPKNKGTYTRTAGELVDALSRTRSIEEALGTPNESAGAWIRFNPLSGDGVRNIDVADYRYALVESDSMAIEDQMAMIEELRLPCKVVVHSGGKSLHAIVKIDAKNLDQYRERVERLYRICADNRFTLDTQNKNPSRLSRFPGFMRGGKRQYIVSGECGAASWQEWIEWYDDRSDDMDEPDDLAEVWDSLPDLAPPLIEGVLRKGHKLLLAGPSKAGKSFALIELCVAIAEGREWLGMRCAKGSVLYVNLELDKASCLHRFRDVYEASGIPPENLANIHIWNLRGKSRPMDKLAAPLIRRALKQRPLAIVIDPIYKVITGDENSADQMAQFCNQFDKIASEVGCAVIYCHHHSKGAQGGKRSMDRASGSGVFARDPDTQLDMIGLPLDDDARAALANRMRCEALCAWADKMAREDRLEAAWRDSVAADDLVVADDLVSAMREVVGDDRALEREMLDASAEANAKAQTMTAWRIEGILREFAGFEPINLWFGYPLHSRDESGMLADIEPEEDQAPWKKAVEKRRRNAKERADSRRQEFAEAVANAAAGEPPTVREIAAYLGVTERTVNNYIKKYGASKTKVDDSTYTVSMPDSEED